MKLTRLFGSVVVVASALSACKRSDAPSSNATSAATITSANATTTTTTTLPGACVDPARDAAPRAKAQSPEDVGEVAERIDFDGDGVADRVFARGEGGTTNGLLLYVVRGTCAHFVGEAHGSGVKVKSPKRGGLADLVVEDTAHCEGDPGPCTPKKSAYRFDGTAYTPTK